VPGSEGALPDDPKEIVKIGRAVGYPVIIKAAGGGGGRGMRVVHTEAALINAVNMTRSEAGRFLQQPDGVHGKVPGKPASRGNPGAGRRPPQRHLSGRARLLDAAPPPESDRRSAGAGHQPARADRARVGDRCAEACRKINYRGAGTFEFLYENGEFYFIEMNTRVQVEHPVTELITGIDIVQEQIRIAAGEKLASARRTSNCAAMPIECRINAEDPFKFTPSPGKIVNYHPPGGPGIRVDSHAYSGLHRAPALRLDGRQSDCLRRHPRAGHPPHAHRALRNDAWRASRPISRCTRT
jgi:acetyl-CoA carboxylase biotin carboxylase subunit